MTISSQFKYLFTILNDIYNLIIKIVAKSQKNLDTFILSVYIVYIYGYIFRNLTISIL